MKPREFWISYSSLNSKGCVHTINPIGVCKFGDHIHAIQVCPERETAIEKMVEALEDAAKDRIEANPWTIIVPSHAKLAQQALDAYRKAMEE